MKIQIIIGANTIEGMLYDNPTARDFTARLPMTMELKDYAGKEKIYTFSNKLSLEKAPSGSEGMTGDITYYAPWGNLAIFYKDHGYASGLVPLGRIENAGKLEELCRASCQVTIEQPSD